MKRREFLFRTSSAVAVALSGCGGSTEASPPPVAANQVPSSSASPPSSPSLIPLPPPSGPSARGLPVLTLHGTQTGTFPYMATAFPLEGAVPNGQTIVSPDDPSLSAAVLSRWPDGSASVVVLAGQIGINANAPRQIALQAGTKASSALNPGRVGALVSSIAVSAGAVGSATLNAFASPEKIWWSNERVICCRYRLPVGNAGFEAIIDVHAFSSEHAFVEIVVENGKVDTATPTAPSAKSYIDATVVVNGKNVATVSNPTKGTFGGQSYFRSPDA